MEDNQVSKAHSLTTVTLQRATQQGASKACHCLHSQRDISTLTWGQALLRVQSSVTALGISYIVAYIINIVA